MAQPFIDKVVTANDLREGDVVYLTETNNWTRHLSEAEVLQDKATAKARLAAGSGWRRVTVATHTSKTLPK